jgi:hypothetical protein
MCKERLEERRLEVTTTSLSELSPTERLNAEGRLLAGYLSEELASGMREFVTLPSPIQASAREKFGRGGNLDRQVNASHPKFRRVDEADVIQLLAAVAMNCGGRPALSNLVGFEWLRISDICAGHYVAAPLPQVGRTPGVEASRFQIARFCIFGADMRDNDIVQIGSGELMFPEPLVLNPQGFNIQPQQLSVQYAVGRAPSPVSVLYAGRRVVAVKHQERLVALCEQGVEEALCLVFYGYGVELLTSMPTIDGVMDGPVPPRIPEFLDASLSEVIPVHTPRFVVGFSHHVVDFSIS